MQERIRKKHYIVGLSARLSGKRPTGTRLFISLLYAREEGGVRIFRRQTNKDGLANVTGCASSAFQSNREPLQNVCRPVLSRTWMTAHRGLRFEERITFTA